MLPFEDLPRRKPIKRAHVIDASGEDSPTIVRVRCDRCGWESGWIKFPTVTEAKKGAACPNCNEEEAKRRTNSL